MKTYELVKGLEQNYENYTEEDFLVWKILFERQMEQLECLADQTFMQGIKDIGFNESEIPNFDKVNNRLKSLTGWQIVVVPGIIDQHNFFRMLANKQFPSSTWLRKLDQLDYLSEPDMFHDAFGHMPLLTNKTFCEFYKKLGEIGVTNIHNDEIVEKLGRLYWFTVEFGIIKSAKDLKIYGAGILSSIGETKYCLTDVPSRRPFNLMEVLNTDFDNTKIQNLYFVIDDYEQLISSLNKIDWSSF